MLLTRSPLSAESTSIVFSSLSKLANFNQTSVGHSVRLACLRHAASVNPEPGSNSQNKSIRFRNWFCLILTIKLISFYLVFKDHFYFLLFFVAPIIYQTQFSMSTTFFIFFSKFYKLFYFQYLTEFHNLFFSWRDIYYHACSKDAILFCIFFNFFYIFFKNPFNCALFNRFSILLYEKK